VKTSLKARGRVVLVGGGISGLSIAVRLSQCGLPVIVLESGCLGSGASSKNQGWLYSGAWFAPRQPHLAQACYESLKQTIDFCDECLEPATPPMIFIISSAAKPDSLWTEAWKRVELPYQQMTIEQAVAETQIAAPLVRHAFRLPDRAIQTDVLLRFLTTKAEHQGVEVRTKTTVTRLLQEGNHVTGVVTSSGKEVLGDLVILAANGGGKELCPNPNSTMGQQAEFTRVGLKTHCLTARPRVAMSPYCIVDLNGFSHAPHGNESVFGSSRWVVVTDARDRTVIGDEIRRLRAMLSTVHPQFEGAPHQTLEWAGSTVQAMHVDQVEPGVAPMPTVIDHECEPPCVSNLLSVFPGRATLWPQLAEMTRVAVLNKFGLKHSKSTEAPWAVADRGA
jgi:glycine/D-amino acid oxidase-like deaminating enzyme